MDYFGDEEDGDVLLPCTAASAIHLRPFATDQLLLLPPPGLQVWMSKLAKSIEGVVFPYSQNTESLLTTESSLFMRYFISEHEISKNKRYKLNKFS